MTTTRSARPRGSVSRYREVYARLPPSIQLIGMQLWLPVCFVVLFCLCYIAAFHAPVARDAPVGLVAASTERTAAALQTLTGPALSYSSYATTDEARSAVRDGRIVAAVVLSREAETAATLYVASAHQYQSARILEAVLQPALAAQGLQVERIDLAPLPEHDSFGMTTLYLMLAWCISGYMVAMFIGLAGEPLRHWVRVAIIVGGAVVLALLSNFLAGPVIGAVSGHFWMLVAIATGWVIAIGLAVNGLSYFAGRFIALPAVLVFVFLSVPSSGAALPTWMLPSFFHAFRPCVVGYGVTEMIKRTLYGVGEPYVFGLTQMLCYAGVGLVLMAVGRPWRQRREIHRIIAGRTTMFADAQRANAERGRKMREMVLARYGVAEKAGAEKLQDSANATGDPFVNYGQSLSLLQNDARAPAGADASSSRAKNEGKP